MEKEAEKGQRVSLVFDNGVGTLTDSGDKARFERLVSEAATAAHHFIEKGYEVELKLFRYSRVDPQVERFNKSDKKEVNAKWRKLEEAIRTTVGAIR